VALSSKSQSTFHAGNDAVQLIEASVANHQFALSVRLMRYLDVRSKIVGKLGFEAI